MTRRSPFLELGIYLMTEVVVAAVMMWILFQKKVGAPAHH